VVTGGLTGVVTGGLTGVVTGGLTGVVTGGLTGVVTGGLTGVVTGGLTGVVTGGLTGGVSTGRLTVGGTSDDVLPSPSPQAESIMDTTQMLSAFTGNAIVFFNLLPQ
uniref:hypothetical protein n=1 Tax=Psychrobacter sp. TaxID=56811 RepID=UPI003567612C